MQKSQEGLPQSLLFEILRQYPALIQIVCASRWQEINSHIPSPEFWSRSELLNAFRRLIRKTLKGSKFCFSIDGLDEYDGNHLELIDLLKSIFHSSSIMICVSSRPWNVFQDD